jgi:signal transduction histidine kinase
MRMMPRTDIGKLWQRTAGSLSARLLFLTCVFVLISEVVIFVPSIGRHHREILENHILSADLAILPFTEPGGDQLSDAMRRMLLTHADAEAVLLKYPDQRQLYLNGAMPESSDVIYQLEPSSPLTDTARGLDCLFFGGSRTLRLVSPTRIRNAEEISVVLGEAPVRAGLIDFAGRLIGIALFVSALTALLVFAALHFFLVRPMRRIITAMAVFRENPEDAGRILEPSAATGEIGQAEHELAAMQHDLQAYLRQKARLAALGAAVARIQHDLRNILASAQLASDRMAASEDAVVKRFSPRLVAALDRAVKLAASTLAFGRSVEHPPRREIFMLAGLAEEAAVAALEARAPAGLRFENRVPADLSVHADREQMFRVLMNLVRNAAEALEGRGDGLIAVRAARAGEIVFVEVADNGPGILDAYQAKLFQPFAITSHAGGSGLGLAIARELVRGHGGDLVLVSSGPSGTVLRITLPAG